MEDELTLEELYALQDAKHRDEERRNRFAAAIQGINLDEGQSDSDFESVKQRAQATLAGRSEEEYTFDLIGIEIESDDD